MNWKLLNPCVVCMIHRVSCICAGKSSGHITLHSWTLWACSMSSWIETWNILNSHEGNWQGLVAQRNDNPCVDWNHLSRLAMKTANIIFPNVQMAFLPARLWTYVRMKKTTHRSSIRISDIQIKDYLLSMRKSMYFEHAQKIYLWKRTTNSANTHVKPMYLCMSSRENRLHMHTADCLVGSLIVYAFCSAIGMVPDRGHIVLIGQIRTMICTWKLTVIYAFENKHDLSPCLTILCVGLSWLTC